MADDQPEFNPAERSGKLTLAILGLGLMGGSLALALRDLSSRDQDASSMFEGKRLVVLGIDPDPLARELACQMQIADRVSADLGELLPLADVIILAAPVGAILDLLDEIPALHPDPALVLDLGSTKVEIMQRMQALPERFDPIGGHPMCGKEKLSLANADANLYQDAPFVFTALPRTSPRARHFAEYMARSLGARPLWLDPITHDRWIASTSHLPYLVANVLANVTPIEAAPLVGPGFRSATRLAPTPPSMMMDVIRSNRTNILSAARNFRLHLEQIEKLLEAGDFTALQDDLAQGGEHQKKILNPRFFGDGGI
jgi:prephenate dehydrogenase